MKKVSKLKKVALMDPTMFENTLDQISDKGRTILKAIEEYKFSIDQTLRVVKNDPTLTNIISQKKKNLDHAAQDLYTIVFEIENVDISEAYNEQQDATDPNKTEEAPEDENKPQAPGAPQTPQVPPTPGTPPAAPATPEAKPEGTEPEKKPEDDKKEEEKDKEEPKK